MFEETVRLDWVRNGPCFGHTLISSAPNDACRTNHFSNGQYCIDYIKAYRNQSVTLTLAQHGCLACVANSISGVC